MRQAVLRICGLLMWWIDGRQRPSEAEVDALFRTMALPAFTTVATPAAIPPSSQL